MTEPRERPIIFSAESVGAILAGRKTQTRRVWKYQPLDVLPMPNSKAPNGVTWVTLDTKEPESHGRVVRCRFGIPGDRLWVRESFTYITLAENEQRDARTPDGVPVRMLYKSDADADGWADQCKWYSPIHMPRWASRIQLEIVKVRAEKLHEITIEDIVAEGFAGKVDLFTRFGTVWNDLNAKRGFAWESNPWVWVIEFKRVQDGKE